MSADRRRDTYQGRLSRIYQPDAVLLNAATEVAVTAQDPELRLYVWSALGGPGIPRIDPAALVDPARTALEKEADLRVQLTLVNILTMSPANPQAREALSAIAIGDAQRAHPRLVRMAARRALGANDDWNDYFVATLDAADVADSERLEVIRHASSLRGINREVLRYTAPELDAAAIRSLAALIRRQDSTELAMAAANLLSQAGGAAGRDELTRFLRAGTGQPDADRKVRQFVLTSFVLGLRTRPENRSLLEEVMTRDLEPAMREAARQALEQTR